MRKVLELLKKVSVRFEDFLDDKNPVHMTLQDLHEGAVDTVGEMLKLKVRLEEVERILAAMSTPSNPPSQPQDGGAFLPPFDRFAQGTAGGSPDQVVGTRTAGDTPQPAEREANQS